jgi:sucrose phosphorylase
MSENRQKITHLLTQLYGLNPAEKISTVINDKLNKVQPHLIRETSKVNAAELLSEKDAILITYGDQFLDSKYTPLQSLSLFLRKNLQDVLNGVHILPFFTYSSDDGFAVIHYCQVDPAKGSWQDIANLKKDYKLMFDLVANHISSQSDWFQNFLSGMEPYNQYFMTLDADTDLSSVVRPRATPILTPFETAQGTQYVWTTFGVVQIDLNYHNPLVLLEMVDILLYYLTQGANIIRLDAIAYLWKIPGTSCIHLPQTHAVVKLFRAILDVVAPEVLLITETNVPHAENISYFGEYVPELHRTDEAQLVYQFPLAPLILHTFLKGNTSRLSQWAADLPQLVEGTAFFNFTASHDGIGIRPAENILQAQDIQALIEQTLAHGGRVSYKTNTDGSQSAYELNITWFDALNNPANPQSTLDVARFLASQAIMLSLAGVPGIYVHSLFGSRNYLQGVEETGRERSINREKFSLDALQQALDDPQSLKSMVFRGYRQLLRIRKQQAAFHPSSDQRILQISTSVFSVLRTSASGETLLCLINVTDKEVRMDLDLSALNLPVSDCWRDLLSTDVYNTEMKLQVSLMPYQSRWIKRDSL